jgi:hypothetical protein
LATTTRINGVDRTVDVDGCIRVTAATAMLRWTLSRLDLVDAASSGAAAEREQPDDVLAARGTIVHRRWSGSDPTVFIENQGIQLNVTCRSPTKGLDDPHLPGPTGALSCARG